MKSIPLSLMASALFLSLVAARALAAVPPEKSDGDTMPPSPAAYRKLADEIEANFRTEVLAKWFPVAIDVEKGGYHQNFREDWSREPKSDRSLVYQSRLIWVAAQAAMRYPTDSAAYKGYSRHGLEFLDRKLWDRENGGFFWALDENGIPERKGEKHAYGIAFGIYAAGACYQATREPRALDLAKRAFTWLDAHAHDKEHGGYYEALSREGKPILSASSLSGANDFIGTHYGYKSMNTHIHLLEALTGLYAVWPDAGVRHRLQEVFALVRDRIAVAPGCLNLFFTPDWRPVPDHDSFGHDVEAAYLLVEASTALGRPDDAVTWRVARQLVDHALEYGWDREHGGFYDAGTAFGPPLVTDKIWWTQAEGLNALTLMHARYGRETPRYWEALNRQWQFIHRYQVDSHYGGWYGTVLRNGSPVPGRVKSDRWTEAYHQGRALMLVSEELRRMASKYTPSGKKVQ